MAGQLSDSELKSLQAILAETDDDSGAVASALSLDEIIHDDAPNLTSNAQFGVDLPSKSTNQNDVDRTLVAPQSPQLRRSSSSAAAAAAPSTPLPPQKPSAIAVMSPGTMKVALDAILSESDDPSSVPAPLLDADIGDSSNLDNMLRSFMKAENAEALLAQVRDSEEKLNDVNESRQILQNLEERRRRAEMNTSTLSLSRLEKLSNRLAQMRQKVGSPTSMAISTKFIAIGTSHGLAIVFDHFQEVKLILGTRDGAEYGPVLSMDISFDSEWLACGHAQGPVVVWDLEQGEQIRAFLGEHFKPITFLRFIDNKKNRLLSCSLDGVMKLLHVRFLSLCAFLVETLDAILHQSLANISRILIPTHFLTGEEVTPQHANSQVFSPALNTQISRVLLMWMANVQVVLNGAAGPILCMSNLAPSGATFTHPIDNFSLAAYATSRKVAVISVQQTVKAMFQIPRPPEASIQSALPYIAWREAIISESTLNGKRKALDPVLAVGWGTIIKIFTVVLSRAKSRPTELDFVLVAEIPTDAEITSLAWVTPSVLVIQNIRDELRVIDPFALEEIEIAPIKQMEVVYHTKFDQVVDQLQLFDGARVHFFSFHNSLRIFRNRLYILGLRSIFSAHVLTWEERIAGFVERGKWVEALGLALDFYQGRGRAVEGLPKDMNHARQVLSAKIETLMHDYVQAGLAVPNPKEGQKHYDTIATIAIDFCLSINREDILFETLFPLFVAAKRQGQFLQKLEPFILGDKLTKLPPHLIQRLVAHYSQAEQLRRVEQIILHLDIASIDFHQVVKLCQKHYLSSALFFLFIQALNDYITPLDYLMKVLVKDSHLFGTNEQVQRRKAIGYKIMVYLEYVFGGRNFPTGDSIPLDKQDVIKQSLFEYLLKERIDAEPDVTERFPRIASLLHVDTAEFLRVLSVAFDSISDSSRLKRWIDVLTNLMIDSSPSTIGPDPSLWLEKQFKTWPFSSTQVGKFLEFIAKYFARGLCDVGEFMAQRMFGYLLLPGALDSKPEREKLLLEILYSNRIASQKQELDRILLRAEQGEFFKVCEFFYRESRDFAQVIRCHLKDSDLRKSIFTFIERLMRDGGSALILTAKEKEVVKNCTLSSLSDLVKIDSDATSALICDVFAAENERVVRELEPFPELQFSYLKSVQQQVNNGKESIQISVSMGEKLLELMCRFDKDSVKDWLSESNNLYRLDTAISLTSKYGITSAYCMLLERAGDLSKALDIVLLAVDKQVQQLLAYIRMITGASLPQDSEGPESLLSIREEAVKKALTNAISFCRRNAKRLEPQEMKQLWFRLLDSIMKPMGDLESASASANSPTAATTQEQSQQTPPETPSIGSENPTGRSRARRAIHVTALSEQSLLQLTPAQMSILRTSFTRLISYIIENMIGHIPMQTILEKLVQDRGDSHFGDFKPIFTMMMDNYEYELNILATAGNLLKSDTYSAFRALLAERQRAHRALKFQESEEQSKDHQGDKIYRYRVEQYRPPVEQSRLAMLHQVELGNDPILSFSSRSERGQGHGTLSQELEARRRELYFQNKFELSERRPGMLHRESKYKHGLPEDERSSILSSGSK